MNRLDFAKINSKSQARVPDDVMDELDVEPGEGLDFKKNPDNGNVIVEKLNL